MKKFLTSVATVAFAVFAAGAQLVVPQDSKVLIADPAVRYGKLPNGLTYYIRHNEWPKDRASFYIAQRVGAVLEDDSQNGLAHFLEHMAFNGTKNYPGKGLINYLETNGVTFGANINAYTSFDETVYNLDDVPTTRMNLVDSALLVLHDWSGFISLEGSEIDKERGVIMEEWRTRNNGNSRVLFKHRAKTLQGTPYEVRDIIGDTAVIRNFKYEEIRNYYHKWYRPDLQGIIVVGDIDVDYIEKKITEMWQDIPGVQDATPRPYFAVALNGDKPIVSVASDKEATHSLISFAVRSEAIPFEQRQNPQVYYVNKFVQGILTRVVDERFSDICKKQDAPVIGAGCYDNEVCPLTVDELEFVFLIKKGQVKESVQLLFDEVEKLKRWGLTNAEVERAAQTMLKGYENAYNSRETAKTGNFVREYVSSFTDFEPCLGIDKEYELAKMVIPRLTAGMLNQMLTKAGAFDKNVVITLSLPDSEQGMTEEELLAVYNQMGSRELVAYEDVKFDKPLVPQEPKAGKIKKEYAGIMGTTVLELSNGIKVYLLPTDYQKNSVSFEGVGFGGVNALKPEDVLNGGVAAGFVNSYGWGEYSDNEISKILSSKTASMGPTLGGTTQGYRGGCATNDFETMLQLFYLQCTAPREDAEVFAANIGATRTSLQNRVGLPSTAFNDTLNEVLYVANPYNVRLKLDNLDQIDMAKTLAIYKERFANPANNIYFIVGDFDIATVKPLIEKWMGGLKTTKKIDKLVLRDLRMVDGENVHNFDYKMETPKTTSFTLYHGLVPAYDRALSYAFSVLGDVLDMRYLESVREDEGGTYGVSVRGNMSNSKQCADGFRWTLQVYFDTDPERFDRIYPIIVKEIEKIAAEGPRADDFGKVRDANLKKLEENIKKNGWWQSNLRNYFVTGMDHSVGSKELIEGLTPDQVKAAAQMVLKASRTIVNMMPEKQ